MKTQLPRSIKTIQEAKDFLTALYNNGESYHPEDSATDIDFTFPVSRQDKLQLDRLMNDIYALPGNDGSHTDLVFDPCGWLLNLDFRVGETVVKCDTDSALPSLRLTIIDIDYDKEIATVRWVVDKYKPNKSFEISLSEIEHT